MGCSWARRYFLEDYVGVVYHGPRILEDDVVEFYGTVREMYTATDIFGIQGTAPLMDATQLRLVEEG